jgi:methionyl-tRNA formyltransferase
MKKMSKTIKTSGRPQIVFFGSGPVAAKSLELLTRDFAIEAVFTKPRPPHHRGDTPVLALCEKLKFKTFTPVNRRELSAAFAKKPVTSTLGIVIDYGIIIAQDVIDYFPLGIVNSHFSLLPQWRGADPITFSVLSGQEVSGVSLMLITAGLDEGPLLSQAPYILSKDITTPELTEDLVDISYASLKEIVPLYITGHVCPRNQDLSTPPTFSRKLTKDDGILDWTKPAEVLEREIRAFIEWPKSRTTLGGKDIIVTRAHVALADRPGAKPGQIEVAKDIGSITIACGKGSLCIDQLKPAGKKQMTAAAFLAGYGHLFK